MFGEIITQFFKIKSKMKIILGLLALACVSSAFAEKARFDNYRVYTISIQSEKQLQTIQALENNPDGYLFWSDAKFVGGAVDIMVAPHKFAEYSELTNNLSLDSKLKIANVQELIENEQPKVQPRAFGWTSYHTLSEIFEWLDKIVTANPEVLTHISAGDSYEGRAIRGVKLSHGEGRKAIILESNIHAREWITSATNSWILNEFLTSEDPEVQALASNYDWHFILVANPDGFAYTHETNRLWRKTRQPHSDTCVGADPNRNFDYQWMYAGASANPCSETFAGPAPWSEIESSSLANYFASIPDLVAYLSFHSYGQYMLLPFGHDSSKPANYEQLMTIGNASAASLAQRYGTAYTVGTTFDVLYAASGLSIDYTYAVLDVPVAFCWEFRDKGANGFVLPASQIIPNSEEVLDGLITFVDEINKAGYFN